MPQSKSQLRRLIVIDKCLRSSTPRYTTKRLVEVVSEATGDEISVRSIQDDLKFIRQYVPDFPAKDPYNYPVSGTSLFKELGKHEGIPAVNDILSLYQAYILSQEFFFLPAMKEVWKEFEHLDKIFQEEGFHIGRFFQLDFNRKSVGLSHIPTIVEAIAEKRKLVIQYKSFRMDEPIKFVLEPYLIKEYNNRWYLIGFDTERMMNYVNLGLDRILSISVSRYYFTPMAFNPDTFFEDVVGVTIKKELPVQEVLFSIQSDFAPFVETKPIHSSQVVLNRDDDATIFRIFVRPNKELLNHFLHLGAHITLLSPESLVELYKVEVENMLRNHT